jgi:hypothetical protein
MHIIRGLEGFFINILSKFPVFVKKINSQVNIFSIYNLR